MQLNIILGYGLAVATAVLIVWFFKKLTTDKHSRSLTH